MNTNYLPERDLLIYLLRQEFYDSYFDSIDLQHIKAEYKELYHVYKVLQSLHQEYLQDFKLEDLQAAFFTKYPDLDKGIYLELFKTLSEAPIDPTLGVGILKQLKRRKTALNLSEAAFRYSTGQGELTPVNDLLKELNNDNPETTEEFEFVSGDLEKLLHEVYQDKGLRWRLDCLNRSLGSLRKGNFGFLFARPESGKTTFLASEVSFMLEQLSEDKGPIIWFNNEQVGAEVMLRVHQGFHGTRLEQLLGSVSKYRDSFPSNRFRLVDDALIGRSKVEAICKQLNPSLVVFDQIDKIKGFDADREDLRLGAIYIWARELAKRYCPVIGVCQADGTAEGQKWLTMDNVANAKTSKQAEADWILGMGNTHAEGAEYIRYLNISKNKLLGDEDTIPHMRHARMQVLIEPEIARFSDLERYD